MVFFARVLQRLLFDSMATELLVRFVADGEALALPFLKKVLEYETVAVVRQEIERAIRGIEGG